MTTPQLPIVRIVPVVAHAVAVFGDEHKASHWLSTPLPLLENRAPSELLNSDGGIQRVDETLTRSSTTSFPDARSRISGLPAHLRASDGEGSRKVGGAGILPAERLCTWPKVVQGEWNYLINPQHLDFAQITVEPPVPMRFDERLSEST